MIGWTNVSLDDTVKVNVREGYNDNPFSLTIGGSDTFSSVTLLLTKEILESLAFQSTSALHEYDLMQENVGV